MGKIHICILLLGFLSPSTLVVSQEYFIDPGVTLVENWDGWGTSLAWWADVLGGLNEDVRTAITTAFFHPDKLNINIVRYVIGGTTPSDVEPYPCGDYREGAATESFKDGPGSEYNWTRDARQRDILLRAQALGVNTFEAFSNSPPQCPLLHANFAAEKADEFADYATEVIRHFHENFGVTFTTYAPFNEAFGLSGIGGWFGETNSQEGCNMNRSVMAAVVRSVHQAIIDKGLDFVNITTADETQVSTAFLTQEYFRDQGLSSVISKVNVHGYWDVVGNRRDQMSILCHKEGHRLWMDEMGWGESLIGNMTQGLEIANRIVKDFRYLFPSAWVYWQAMENIGAWGLIGFPYSGSQTVDEIQYNSGYYSMMQFSRYIKQGYKIIYSSDPDSVVAMDETSKTLVIVTVNNAVEAVSKSFNLNLLSSIGNIEATRTAPNEPNVPETSVTVDANLILRVETVPESITTIIISDVTFAEETISNLLKNGDFESEDPSEILAWTFEGEGDDDLYSGVFPWRGDKSGFLSAPTDSNSTRRVSQIVKLPTDNLTTYQLFLSAWASTTGSATTLTVNVIGSDGETSEEVSVSGFEYAMYGLSLKGKGGDEVKVHFDSLDGVSYVDNVVLHLVKVEG